MKRVKPLPTLRLQGFVAGAGMVLILTHVMPRSDLAVFLLAAIGGTTVFFWLYKPQGVPVAECIVDELRPNSATNLSAAGASNGDDPLLAQQALDESEERFRVLFEDAPVAYHEIDATGIICRVNQTECKLLGFSRCELIGRPVWELVAPEERDTSRDAVHQKLAGTRKLAPFTREYIRRDGTHIVVEIHEKLITNYLGAVIGIRTVMLDITEKRLLEEQLRQAQKLESIGRLAGGIAHDFNNLLTIISGRAELLLLQQPNDAQLRASLHPISEAAKRATALTGQLLAYGRRQILEQKPLDLNKVVCSASEMLQPLIGEDVELKMVTATDLPLVKTDQARLEQVIMNLAVNARDAMPRGGKLTIETATVTLDAEYARQHMDAVPGNYVMLAVSDTGIGMDEQTRARIFEPFFTTKELGKGTGLGLAVVYGIVKQSGGNIWVYSEPGKGTCFKVYLPVAGVSDSEKPRKCEPDIIARGSETVLLVEDEGEVRALARESLERSGYRVLEASNGNEALEVCEHCPERIDLLLTDVVMPGMSGLELAKRLASLQPDMKVLYTSGYTDDTVIRHGALESGMAYIQKPFGSTTLSGKVREVLDAEHYGRVADSSGLQRKPQSRGAAAVAAGGE